MSAGPEILRATILHTPRNPFKSDGALESFTDGALVIADGRILATGDYAAIRAQHPDAVVSDLRGSVILPGFIDTHVHFPQTRIIGRLGPPLFDWLELHALPEEQRMADTAYARSVAAEFVQELVRHGTTTAVVFGAHFGEATACLFDAASAVGIRIASGLVHSDRLLPEPLLQTPEQAYRTSKELIGRFHYRNGQRYAVTPRFALSASEGMLEVCSTLLREHPDVLFQTHLNENPQEIEQVRRAFPWAKNYLAAYDRYGLAGPRSVFAHNVHPSEDELERLASTQSAVAHCPCSNAALGSGIFPMGRHLAAGVHFALGTDVGAGIGFGMPKEALQSYLMQRVLPDGELLSAAHLLYLATRAGAESLGLEEETGDFMPGKSADLVVLRPPSTRAESPEQLLAAILTQSGAEIVREVRVRGKALVATS